jgi:hypothetical protein
MRAYLIIIFQVRQQYVTEVPLSGQPLNQDKEETAIKKDPVAKLPWDPDEFVRMPFHKRDEYARTHVEDPEAPPYLYRGVNAP